MKLAQIDFGSLENIATPDLGGTTLGNIVSILVTYLLPLAGLLLLVYLIFAGFQYLTSGGDPKKIEVAKQRLTSGIIGFIVVFISYWLVQLVAKVLGLTKITEIFG